MRLLSGYFSVFKEMFSTCCISSCGKFVAASSMGGTICVWNVESGQLLSSCKYVRLGETKVITSMIWHPILYGTLFFADSEVRLLSHFLRFFIDLSIFLFVVLFIRWAPSFQRPGYGKWSRVPKSIIESTSWGGQNVLQCITFESGEMTTEFLKSESDNWTAQMLCITCFRGCHRSDSPCNA